MSVRHECVGFVFPCPNEGTKKLVWNSKDENGKRRQQTAWYCPICYYETLRQFQMDTAEDKQAAEDAEKALGGSESDEG